MGIASRLLQPSQHTYKKIHSICWRHYPMTELILKLLNIFHSIFFYYTFSEVDYSIFFLTTTFHFHFLMYLILFLQHLFFSPIHIGNVDFGKRERNLFS
ncbi:unnamed protein product [Amoebophrya sp. A120]|nr:unnamed protein product [Amoebophrya sp. A120]|eukprot:GSA120T00006881001.1